MELSLLATQVTRPQTRATSVIDPARVTAGSRTALNLQALMSVLEARAAPLAREVATLAREALTVFVVEPPGAGALRIEIGRQFVTVPPTLRDAVLALLVRPGDTSPAPAQSLVAATPAAAQAVATAVVPTALLATSVLSGAMAVVQTAGGQATREPRAPRSAAATAIDTRTVFLDSDAAAPRAAQKISAAVQNSGVFFEAHVAQWAQGTRSADALRAELTQLGGAGTTPSTASGQRVAAQLEVLQHATVTLCAQAWVGQACELQLRRERSTERDDATPATDPAAVHSATLTLDLPCFGPLQVVLRLSGSSVAVTAISSAAARAQLVHALPALGEALQSRGLNPAALIAAEEHAS